MIFLTRKRGVQDKAHLHSPFTVVQFIIVPLFLIIVLSSAVSTMFILCVSCVYYVIFVTSRDI